MGQDYNLIILFVILGAAALVVCSYAVARISGNFEIVESDVYPAQQQEYMREVRQRNVGYLQRMMKGSRQHPPQTSVVSPVVIQHTAKCTHFLC
jgi:hypothetical protein